MLLLATDRRVYRADLDPVHVVVARPGAAGDVETVPLFRGPVTVERRAVALDAHGFGQLTLGPLPAGRYTLGGWSRAPGASFEVRPADPLGLDDDGPPPSPPRELPSAAPAPPCLAGTLGAVQRAGPDPFDAARPVGPLWVDEGPAAPAPLHVVAPLSAAPRLEAREPLDDVSITTLAIGGRAEHHEHHARLEAGATLPLRAAPRPALVMVSARRAGAPWSGTAVIGQPAPEKVDVYFKQRGAELGVDLILPPGRTGTALVVARRVRAGPPADWGARLAAHAWRDLLETLRAEGRPDPALAPAARPPLSATDDVPAGTTADHPHVARELDALLDAAVRADHRAIEIHLEAERVLVRATGGPHEMIVHVERPRLGRLLVERLRALSVDGTLGGRRRVRFEHGVEGEAWRIDMETDPDPGWRGVRLELSHADDRAREAAAAVLDDPAVDAWRAAGVPPGAPLHFGVHRVPNRVKVPLPGDPGEVEVAVFALTAGIWTCAAHRFGAAADSPRSPALGWRVLAPGEELAAAQAGGRSLTVLASPMAPCIETAEALACLTDNSAEGLAARFHGTSALLELAGASPRRAHLERLLHDVEAALPGAPAPAAAARDLAGPPSPPLLAALRDLAAAGTVTARDARVRVKVDGQVRPVLHLTDGEFQRVAALDQPVLVRING